MGLKGKARWWQGGRTASGRGKRQGSLGELGGALLREVSQQSDDFMLTLIISATAPVFSSPWLGNKSLSSSAVLKVGMVEQGGVP